MNNHIKEISDGSLRGIGLRYKSLPPNKTIIAGQTLNEISNKIGFQSYQIGRINLTNAFVAKKEDIFYIYVNPQYKSHRNLFKKFVVEILENHHIDHILSKNLANYFNYKYVLLCMVPDVVNIRHGRIEKIKNNENLNTLPKNCYFDERTFDKVLSRNPTARRLWDEVKQGYNPNSSIKFGLTLKQKGIWNSAFGFNKANEKFINNKLRIIK